MPKGVSELTAGKRMPFDDQKNWTKRGMTRNCPYKTYPGNDVLLSNNYYHIYCALMQSKTNPRWCVRCVNIKEGVRLLAVVVMLMDKPPKVELK